MLFILEMLHRILSPKYVIGITKLSGRTFHATIYPGRISRVASSHVLRIPHGQFFNLQRERSATTHGTFGSPNAKNASRSNQNAELKDMLKGYSPNVQLQLVEAYRRGVESSVQGSKISKFQNITMIVLRIVSIGLGAVLILFLIRAPDRGLGGGLTKMFDSTVATFAENVDVRFSDVQGVSYYLPISF